MAASVTTATTSTQAPSTIIFPSTRLCLRPLTAAEVHTCVSASAICGRPVGCNRAFEVPKLVAGDETNAFQRRELIVGFAGLIECQIELAQMLVGTTMATIECQRLLIVLHRGPELPQPMMGI